MLERKRFNTNDVLTIKLVSGEEVLARLESETDVYLTVSKPMILTATQSSLGLAPFSITGKQNIVPFYKSNIITILETEDDYSKQYISAVTGIIT